MTDSDDSVDGLSDSDHETRRSLRARFRAHQREYGEAAPCPMRLIAVSPERIEHVIYPLLHTTHDGVTKEGTHVQSGDWDRCPVSERGWFSIGALDPDRFDGFRRLRLDKYAFHELITSAVSDLESYTTAWEEIVTKFPAAVETKYADPEYMRRYYELYHEIRENGYETARERGEKSPYPEFDEVGVYIGRDGEIFSAGFGKHRLVIAQEVGLESIPVRVNVRHEQWQQKRKAAVANGESSGGLSGHPDAPCDGSHR